MNLTPAVRNLKNEVATESAKTREQYEIQAQVFRAMTNPRDELVCHNKIIALCEHPKFAEAAEYSFPRGKKPDGSDNMVTGPSVYFAREAARLYKNIKHGYRVIDVTEDEVHLMGYAEDIETNTIVEAEAKFSRLVQKRIKGPDGRWILNETTKKYETEWVAADEREYRELVGRQAAFLQRNCILQLIPSYLVDEALEKCRETQKKAPGKSREETLRTVLASFARYGVSDKQIEVWAKRKVAELTNENIASLRNIYNSIKDGQSKVEEYFQSTASVNKKENGELFSEKEIAELDVRPVTEVTAEIVPNEN